MKQEKDGKTLYHVQSITEWHDDPIDLFIWAIDEVEVTKNLKTLFHDDIGEPDDQELKDLIENTNIYTVYAEEV